MGESIGAYRDLVGKGERRGLLERSKRRRECNSKMDIRDVRWGYGLDRSGS